MQVIKAKTAGFCFGVKRAVDTVYEQIKQNSSEKIYTYGPIIHNGEVVRDLEEKGVVVLRSKKELEAIGHGTVIIRSHGVTQEIYDILKSQNLNIIDATCPFVKKIHNIVREHSAQGDRIVIIGNPEHPEVQGIFSRAGEKAVVIQSAGEAENFSPGENEKICIVSQTTFNYKKFDKLVEFFSKMRYDRVDILNTICSATEERQSEAREIAGRVDSMIVIGGSHSSNTRKLFEICRNECEDTYYIQTLKDLDMRRLPSRGCVGITAGASTPNNLIEEVSKQCQI